jgi:hypothetical protein
MMGELKPPRPKYEHVYAIIRWEKRANKNTPINLRFTVKKIVVDPAYAEREVERLNKLNGEKGSYYFSQLTRFEAEPIETVPVPSITVDASRRAD